MMTDQDVATLIWHNGNIVPKERLKAKHGLNSLCSNYIIEYFFTNGTEILFFDQTLQRIQSLLIFFYFDSKLLSDKTGETFRNETKRLLIRNKCYKTARCYFLFSLRIGNTPIDEYILLIPDQLLFSIDKYVKRTIVTTRFFKPNGYIMNLPSIQNEFRKILRTEIDHEKVDDCIILNEDQFIVESYLGNIFLIETGIVYTPSISSGCTPLLLRGVMIHLFENISLQVLEKDGIEIEKLFDANEVIVAGETGIYSLKGFEYKRYFDNVRKNLIPLIFENGRD
jgi:branched-subunit amino acid aminotransferase/4-amino-4-deoxychorismate lyase